MKPDVKYVRLDYGGTLGALSYQRIASVLKAERVTGGQRTQCASVANSLRIRNETDALAASYRPL